MYLEPSYGFFDAFGIFGVIWVIIAALIIGLIAAFIVMVLRQRNKDNNSPKLTVSATVVAKRTEVSGSHASTWYYATFQVESGDRIELAVDGLEYGQLVEGDRGSLTFQGTRYLSFKRG